MSVVNTLIIAFASAIMGYFISNVREKQTNWRNLKIDLYREFVSTHAGMADGDAINDDRLNFSRSCNKLSLVASNGVLRTLAAYLKEISISNQNRSTEQEPELRRTLIWEMRKDIGYPPAHTSLQDFEPPFQTSGNRRAVST